MNLFYVKEIPYSRGARVRVTDSGGKRIVRIVKLWRFFKTEYGLHHHNDLLFLGSAVSYYRLLDLQRGIFVDPQRVLCGSKKDHSARLRDRYRGSRVTVEKELFDRYLVGREFFYYLGKALVDRFEALLDRCVCRSGYSSVGNRTEARIFIFDNSVSDDSDARIYAEYYQSGASFLCLFAGVL